MRSWTEIRPEVVTDLDRVAEHRGQLDTEVRAYGEALGGHLRTVADSATVNCVFGDQQGRTLTKVIHVRRGRPAGRGPGEE